MEAGLENVRRHRAMASLCRMQAILDPENAWHWLAHADRWENLVEAEIEEHYRECNTSRDELAA